MERVRVVSNITKEYPDKYKVVVYHEPHIFVHNDVSRKRDTKLLKTFCLITFFLLNIC